MGYKITTEIFKQRATLKHDGFYCYSKSTYSNDHGKILVICPMHGEFQQRAGKHMRGEGCQKCAVDRRAKNKIEESRKKYFVRANKKHNNKYDYSKSVYTKASDKIKIECPEHGTFAQTASAHLQGYGCQKCGIEKVASSRRLTRDEFISRAKNINQGSDLDYSKVKYVNSTTKVCIVCKKHGEFYVTPSNHLRKGKCPKCSIVDNGLLRRIGKNSTISRFKKIHGDKYSYGGIKENALTVDFVKITCPMHGEFALTIQNHLSGTGCGRCSGRKKTKGDFLEEVKGISKGYTFEKFIYTNIHKPTIVTCCAHGDFRISPNNFRKGHGCPECAGIRRRAPRVSQKETISRFKEAHGDRYDYSKTFYVKNKHKVTITCRVHGDFKQLVCHHKRGHGCPKCANFSAGERAIDKILKSRKVDFVPQYAVWTKRRSKQAKPQYLDFYLPDYNIAIEYNGRQHYEVNEHFGGEEGFEKTQERDKRKADYCKKNNIKLITIPYTDKKKIDKILGAVLSNSEPIINGQMRLF